MTKTTTPKSQKNIFEKIHQSFPTISFNSGWKNGTGYLDHAVDGSFEIPDGSFSFVDDKDRRGILFIHGDRRVVIFERYSPLSNGERGNTLVHNASRAFEGFACDELNEEEYPFGTSLIKFNDGDTVSRFELLVRFLYGDTVYDAWS